MIGKIATIVITAGTAGGAVTAPIVITQTNTGHSKKNGEDKMNGTYTLHQGGYMLRLDMITRETQHSKSVYIWGENKAIALKNADTFIDADQQDWINMLNSVTRYKVLARFLAESIEEEGNVRYRIATGVNTEEHKLEDWHWVNDKLFIMDQHNKDSNGNYKLDENIITSNLGRIYGNGGQYE